MFGGVNNSDFDIESYGTPVVYPGFRGWGEVLFYTGEITTVAFFTFERFQKNFKINENFIIFENFKGNFVIFGNFLNFIEIFAKI